MRAHQLQYTGFALRNPDPVGRTAGEAANVVVDNLLGHSIAQLSEERDQGRGVVRCSGTDFNRMAHREQNT